MGGLFSIYRGVTQLASPHQVSPGIAIAVLLIAAVSEAHSFRTTLRRIYALNKNIRWLHWFKTSSRANLLVVFTEDLAALAGIAVALVALMITWLTGDSRWDSVGAIAIGVILVVVTFALTNELRSLLIGESPFKNYKRDVGLLLQEIIPGAKLRGFTAIQTGPEDVTLAYRITPGRIHDVKQLIEKMEILQNRIVEKFPEVHRQFMSPV
jgi:divalent metal cation (Fe/Co/Zn/Cd) transporter